MEKSPRIIILSIAHSLSILQISISVSFLDDETADSESEDDSEDIEDGSGDEENDKKGIHLFVLIYVPTARGKKRVIYLQKQKDYLFDLTLYLFFPLDYVLIEKISFKVVEI